MKKSVFCIVLTILYPAALIAGEFAIINEEITVTESSSGFVFWHNPTAGPTNWIAPDNYFEGQVHCRFEVLEQPTNETFYLSFCIWGRKGTAETASSVSGALAGAGSVTTFSSIPSTWWKQDGGVNFADRVGFLRWGIPFWASKNPHILLAPKGYSKDPRSQDYWSKRQKWFPVRLKATVVAVSQGATFSGWQNYTNTTTAKP